MGRGEDDCVGEGGEDVFPALFEGAEGGVHPGVFFSGLSHHGPEEVLYIHLWDWWHWRVWVCVAN